MVPVYPVRVPSEKKFLTAEWRYLAMLNNGSKEATEAFNRTLTDWASPAPERLLINYQIPIHVIEGHSQHLATAQTEPGQKQQDGVITLTR